MKNKNLKIDFKKINKPLFFSVLVLVLFGIVMVYSASSYFAALSYNDEFYFLKKQIIGAVLGLIALFVAYKIDYKKYAKYKNAIIFVSFVLLIIVLIPYIGVENNGARRWIALPFGFTFQPSEIAKFGFVIFVSVYLSRSKKQVKSFLGILPVLITGGIMCLLILMEPNFSITLCVGLVMVCMLFIGGASLKHFAILAVPALMLIPLLIIMEPYRLDRLMAFIDPWSTPRAEGYQLIQSLFSLGGGGLFGVGLFNSRQKYLFLPFSESDFIFSIIGEELGLFGALIVIILFIVIVWQGIKIANRAKDRFGCYLAVGIISVISIQTLINIAVVTGSIPPTGVPLPFVSAGSTALIVFMAAVGILLNIQKQSQDYL